MEIVRSLRKRRGSRVEPMVVLLTDLRSRGEYTNLNPVMAALRHSRGEFL